MYKNYKFTTRLKLKDENIEIVNSAKLLGTIVTDNLTWDENTNYLVQKAHTRMQLLRKVASFTSSKEEKKIIYISSLKGPLGGRQKFEIMKKIIPEQGI